jgi:hypothetical protein
MLNRSLKHIIMGSWSVSCGISNIAITARQECVILPIKENKNGEGYLPYVIATLPIFGKYDDYGGIEDIEINKNTELIESYFGVTISEFCVYLVDGKNTYDREEAKEIFEKMLNKDVAENIMFMWIDRKVYDFMSTHISKGYDGAGHLAMGTPELLKFIGFEYIGENPDNGIGHDPKRYRHEWKFQDKTFFSDNRWVNYGTSGIYSMKELSKIVNIPEDKKFLFDKAQWQLWNIMSKRDIFHNFCGIFGYSRSDILDIDFSQDILDKMPAFRETYSKNNNDLFRKYIDDIENFGDSLAELRTIRANLYPMSGKFTPHVLYLTPQCGEYKEHQVMLDEFSKINRSYIFEEDEEEDN